MSESITRYLAELQERIAVLAADEVPALSRAADLCAEALSRRNIVHLYDTGHLISHEMIARTGGLVAYTPLSFGGALHNQNLWRAAQPHGPHTAEEKLASERTMLNWVFAQGTVQAGDVLIIGSVSGTGLGLVELALEARNRGLAVIALTAPAHSGRLAPQHPSGQRLYEVADVVLDNHAPYGDSFFAIDGLDRKVGPLSGIGAAILMWALIAGIVQRLVDRGVEPSIYTSIHLPGGPEAVEEVEQRYREQGV